MPCVNQARKSQQFDQKVEMSGFETLNYGFSVAKLLGFLLQV